MQKHQNKTNKIQERIKFDIVRIIRPINQHLPKDDLQLNHLQIKW